VLASRSWWGPGVSWNDVVVRRTRSMKEGISFSYAFFST
jgi:hypothetical protein